jgi:hypothetical protein
MPKPDRILAPDGYWHRSQLPLQALIFLLPLLVAYELALLTDELQQVGGDIKARLLLHLFFGGLGATAYHLPALSVIVVLLCWHLARRDPWTFRPRLVVGMWCESIALALPIFVFQMVLLRYTTLQSLAEQGNGGAMSWRLGMVFAIGAGIYEELLFRLIAISMLHMVLADFMKVPPRRAVWVTVGLSSIAFGLYHFDSWNVVQWTAADWGRFQFSTFAGVYLALLFVYRGFGIAVGTHALYDVFVELQKLMMHAQDA